MQFIAEHFAKALTYLEYRKHAEEQLEAISSDLTNPMNIYGKLNLQRIKRLEKTVVLTDELKNAIENIHNPLIFVILSEGWCGDAAQNLAVFEKMEAVSTNKIELKLLLRDDNLEIMDNYLTNGGRAIPIVIALDKATGNQLFVWGPRPTASQLIMDKMKAENATLEQKIEAVHTWYAHDKTLSVQKELVELLEKIAFSSPS